MKLVTNNPKFKDDKFKNIEIEYLDIDYGEVLIKVRDYVHSNWKLTTHPLYGSIKPNETIYRSIIIEESKSLDNDSVTLISDAITTFTKFRNNQITPNWTTRIREDFSVIDYDLINNAIERIIK